MRIELNAGGLDGLVAIAAFENDIQALERDIDAVIDSFQAVRRATENLKGGVGALDDALYALNRRIEEEAQKKDNLADLSDRFEDFLNLAVSIDKDAAQHVRQNREELYRLHEHLRPPVEFGDEEWNIVIGVVQLFVTIHETTEKLEDFIIETIIEYGDEVLTVVLVVGAIVIGVAVIVVSGGAAAGLILGCACIGMGLGAGAAGIKTYRDDGDVDFLKVLEGGALGAIAGAAVGGAFTLSASLMAKYGATKAWYYYAASNAVQGGGTAFARDFFAQTIIEGDDIGLLNYDILQGLGKTAGGAFSAVVLGAITKGLKIDKLSDSLISKTGISSYKQKLLHDVLSDLPINLASGSISNIGEQLIAIALDKQESFDLGEFITSIALDVAFGMGLNIVDFQMHDFFWNWDPALPVVQNTAARYPIPVSDTPSLTPDPA